jgi:2,3-dihydroxy-2,3-dihydro-p-cumate dehydrogenase
MNPASSNSGRLIGHIAVVTGAAHGIGLAIAQRLGREGAKLVIADIEVSKLALARAQLVGEGIDVDTLEGDLSQQATAEALINVAVSRFGKLDILVNNAGGGVILPFLEHTPETLHTTLNRNLWTTIWCTRAALPPMLSRKYGRIINTGADSVRNGAENHAAYNAAKGGVHGMTTGLAREFAQSGITVNTVAPTGVRTPIYDQFERDHPELVQKYLSKVPMGRPGTMDEVASMIAYLALPEASFVTGQVLSVNGGSTML